jgi:PAS domain S-box-containing protein
MGVRGCVLAARKQSSLALRDSLPLVLDEITKTLSAADPQEHLRCNEVRLARQHGIERSEAKDYDLDQVIEEYHVLRRVIFDVLREGGEISSAEQDVILDTIANGISNATKAFLKNRQERDAESEWKIKESEERYRIVVDGAKDHAIIRTDAAGNIVDWSKGAEQILGFSKDEIMGRPGSIIFTPEDLAKGADEQEMKLARAQGRAEDTRWHMKKNGERFFTTGIMNPLYDTHAKVTGYVKIIRDATAIMKSEQRLKQARSEALAARQSAELARKELHDFFMQAPAAMCIVMAPDYKFTLANPPYERLVGRKVVGKTLYEAFTPEEVSHFIPFLDRVIKTGEPYIGRELPLNIPAGNGEASSLLIDLAYHPFWGDEGQIKGVLAVVQDVTDVARARQKIEESEKQLRLITDAQPNLISYIDRNYRYTFANKAYEKWFGWEIAELVGKTVAEAAGQAIFNEAKPAIDQALAGERITVERVLTYRDGPRFVRMTFIPDLDANGQVRGIFSTVFNITEEKRTEQAIRESEKKFRRLADAMPQIVWTANADGNLDYYNKGFFDYTGFTLEETQGWGWEKIMHPDDFARAAPVWRESIKTGKPYHMEYRLRRRDGIYRWHLGRAVAIRDEHDRIVKWYGTNTDIHDYKILTEELKSARRAAEIASETKSSFLANMSHEIRTPMTAVLGFIEVLKDPFLSEYDRQDAIARIESSGRTLLRVIDDVLDISKIEAGKLSIQKTRFSPFEVASEVTSLLRISAEQKGVSLKFNIDRNTPTVAYSDPSRLRQILTNLLGNAVKFTSRGEVTLQVRAECPEHLVFEVVDTGIGISKEDQAKLFQPFAQADASISRAFGGTGLGLMLSRRLAEQLGGSLSLSESTPGKGSRFTAKIKGAPFEYLSSTRRESLAIEKPDFDQAQVAAALTGIRILLAEDVPDNQVLMQRYLAGSGAYVELANNGVEAISKARGGDYDLVLMDIQMPKLDGIQATKQLRGLGFERPILALTAHAMTEEVERSIEAGCNAHLTKPITKFDLISVVRQYVGYPSGLET